MDRRRAPAPRGGSPYGCEIAGYADDLVTLYPPGDTHTLAAAIGAALDDPASTWRLGPPPRSLTMEAIIDLHCGVYARRVAPWLT